MIRTCNTGECAFAVIDLGFFAGGKFQTVKLLGLSFAQTASKTFDGVVGTGKQNRRQLPNHDEPRIARNSFRLRMRNAISVHVMGVLNKHKFGDCINTGVGSNQPTPFLQ